ncbi:MAG: c-type cytochrome [Phycisphaerales bacterium]|nr:c-type cytochrome [Phycisphaerales bacterium]
MRAWVCLGVGVLVAAALAIGSRMGAGSGRSAQAGRDVHVPVMSPEQSQASMQIQPGFEVSLVAAEPMVEAPVAGVFDEFGRLWVVEMSSYMNDIEGTGELEARNRIVILEDKDRDGVMESLTVFLEGLVLPRAVAPCFGGALVIEPPHLLFCKDTDGDGKADEKRVLLDGFGGLDSPEHAGNGLIYGIDNWWELSQHGVRVFFDGESVATQKTPTHGQWGITRDDVGRLYYTPNSNPLLVDLFPKRYASREGAGGSIPGVGEMIGHDGTTWPAIPTPTVNRGYREGTLRADGTLASLTAACSPVMVRSKALEEEFEGDVFICEPAGQLFKRLKIKVKDDTLDAVNFYKGEEFLRSSDERFRPVNAIMGPDGAVYIFDMYRGLIQHRMFLTPHLIEITKKRGMEMPVNMGRIWRVCVSEGRGDGERVGVGVGVERAKMPGEMSDAELVELLRDGEGWWRDTAQRLLVERRAVEVAGLVREVAFGVVEPIPALHAAWVLEALGILEREDVLRLARCEAPGLRVAALQIAERMAGDDAEICGVIAEGLGDGDAGVRVQAALSVGAMPEAERIAAGIRGYVERGDERLVRAGLRTSLARLEGEVLEGMIAADREWPKDNSQKAVLRELADAALGRGVEERDRLADLAGRLVLHDDARGEMLVDRFKSRVKLDSDERAIVKLSREPSEWMTASLSETGSAETMRRCAECFEWPGHVPPPSHRTRIVRDLTSAEIDLFEQGRKLFTATCIGCHQADGKGSAGLAPALAGSSIANGPASRMMRVLLHGLEGGYMPGGGSWGVMPPVIGKESGELAGIMTYVRRSWGNTGDPVTPASVAKVRQETKERQKPWTRGELDGVRE